MGPFGVKQKLIDRRAIACHAQLGRRTSPGESRLDRVVNSLHGNGNLGGAALGFFITFENDYTLYFSGSTDLTLDMKLWGELYKPDAAILYFASSMDPRDVARMAQFLSEKNPNLKTVIPSHHRLKQTAGRTPADLGESLTALGVKAKLLDPQLGKVYTLSK